MTFKALNALHLFTQVANYESYSAAAQALYMTKGAISYQMAKLENELGFQVFQRQPRGVCLTDQGQTLLIHSKTSFKHLTNTINQLAQQDSDQLTVGMSSYFAARWLSPRLMGFMQHNPQVTLKLQPMIDLQDFLNDGIDIAIRWGNGHWQDIRVEKLFSCPVRAYGGTQVAHQVKAEGLKQVLQKTPLLQDREGSRAWQQWHHAAGIAYYPHSSHLVIPDPSVRLQALIDGQGMALYDDLAQNEQLAGTLIPISEVQLNDYGYYLVYADEALDNPAMRHFRTWILDLAKQEYG
ncbi:LysR substrate-binding domain-containing protein [Candidatus Njordibacter sp. Uisw_039]|jgi:DNA-binding transcriptional LysR family regulator|uniref:LysR substrate-binding domain-containing protein n=1 Tax=Candidatus Njordibacter sp. Uisw_039 TaxID=3230972 RepID=UPI003D59DCB7|tara:strand:- start:882 stop:1763 length:882 start_codon:yes stop_codon:yes gene_type:complete